MPPHSNNHYLAYCGVIYAAIKSSQIAALPTRDPPAVVAADIAPAVAVVVVVDEAFKVSRFRRQHTRSRPRPARPPHLVGKAAGLLVTLPLPLWVAMICWHAFGSWMMSVGVGARVGLDRASSAAEQACSCGETIDAAQPITTDAAQLKCSLLLARCCLVPACQLPAAVCQLQAPRDACHLSHLCQQDRII